MMDSRNIGPVLVCWLVVGCGEVVTSSDDVVLSHDAVQATSVDSSVSDGFSDVGSDALSDTEADAVWADTQTDGGPADGGVDVFEPDTESGCPQGALCVETFPYTHNGDTASSPVDLFDAYACAPSKGQEGPEVIYTVFVEEAGFLSAAVSDDEGVDVDVHILDALSPDACLERGHHHAALDVEPGVYYVVVDSFSKDGQEYSGAYQVTIGLTPPSVGPCAVDEGIMKRVGDGGEHLVMPATGPVVLEAHLVTQEEPKPYPATPTEELAEHYALSQDRTGFVMHRSQNWAPLEGGDFYGAGISSPTLFPVLDEHWYVCMYWTKESRPARGTKMIFRLPGTDRAVVVAAGYETGPGNLANIGGTTEETHFYLGTGHQGELTLGIATDQDIPLGPRRCE